MLRHARLITLRLAEPYDDNTEQDSPQFAIGNAGASGCLHSGVGFHHGGGSVVAVLAKQRGPPAAEGYNISTRVGISRCGSPGEGSFRSRQTAKQVSRYEPLALPMRITMISPASP